MDLCPDDREESTAKILSHMLRVCKEMEKESKKNEESMKKTQELKERLENWIKKYDNPMAVPGLSQGCERPGVRNVRTGNRGAESIV